MIHKETGIQYEIMTLKTGMGNYVPNFEELIAEAPNKDIANKWEECKELLEKTKDSDLPYDGFAFKLVACVLQDCGHYEIFQHPFGSAYTDVDEIMKSFDEENRICTRCVCG